MFFLKSVLDIKTLIAALNISPTNCSDLLNIHDSATRPSPLRFLQTAFRRYRTGPISDPGWTWPTTTDIGSTRAHMQEEPTRAT